MNVIYTAIGTAIGGRTGSASSSDGALAVKLVRPQELGGTGKGGTNPEQLFACGYAACFASTLDHLAGQKKLLLPNNEITAYIGLSRRAEGGFGLTAKLEINLGNLRKEDADALVAQAHTICPYSNSIAGNVAVELVVTRVGS